MIDPGKFSVRLLAAAGSHVEMAERLKEQNVAEAFGHSIIANVLVEIAEAARVASEDREAA